MTHLEPSTLVAEVMCTRTRYETELCTGAAILALLVLGLHRQLVAPYPRGETFDSAQWCCRYLSLPCSLLGHPLEKPEVGRVLRGDFERDEHATLGDGGSLDS